MNNAWKLPKHHHFFNVIPAEVKENLDTEKLSHDPKNMKRKTETSGNKGIMEFWYAYCKVWMIPRDGIKVTDISYLSMQKLKI